MKKTLVMDEISFKFRPMKSDYSKTTEIRFYMNQPILLSGITFSQPRIALNDTNREIGRSNVYIEVSECGFSELLAMSVKTEQQMYASVTFPKSLHIQQNRVISIKIELENSPCVVQMTKHQITSCEQHSIGLFPSESTPLSFISALHFIRSAK